MLPAPPPQKTGWPWTNAQAEARATLLPSTTLPRISIVIPSLNQGRFLEATIRSVLLQDYPNLELILIDGGSTDETPEIIGRYQGWFHYWISEPDHGHGHALNKGFAQATGDILAWLNSDDLYLPNALQCVAQAFATFPAIEWVTSTALSHCDEQEKIMARANNGFSRKYFFAGGYAGLPHAKGWPYECVWLQQESTFWRRNLWERVGSQINEQLKLAVDFELWARFWQTAKLSLLDVPLGCFRVHATQRSRTQLADYQREALNVLGLRRPLLLERIARLYRRFQLSRLIAWETFIGLFYGEPNTIVRSSADGTLALQQTQRLI